MLIAQNVTRTYYLQANEFFVSSDVKENTSNALQNEGKFVSYRNYVSRLGRKEDLGSFT